MNRYGLILLAVGLASGCAPMPQTPDEYRELVSEGAFGRAAKTYAVDRSYSEVASTLEAKAKECFNVQLVETTCIDRSCYDRDTRFDAQPTNRPLIRIAASAALMASSAPLSSPGSRDWCHLPNA